MGISLMIRGCWILCVLSAEMQFKKQKKNFLEVKGPNLLIQQQVKKHTGKF